jgi:hypothetical protein
MPRNFIRIGPENLYLETVQPFSGIKNSITSIPYNPKKSDFTFKPALKPVNIPLELFEMIMDYVIDENLRHDLNAAFLFMTITKAILIRQYRRFIATIYATTIVKYQRLYNVMKILVMVKNSYIDSPCSPTGDMFHTLRLDLGRKPWTLKEPYLEIRPIGKPVFCTHLAYRAMILGETRADVAWGFHDNNGTWGLRDRCRHYARHFFCADHIKQPIIIYELDNVIDRDDIHWQAFEDLHKVCFGEDCGVYYVLDGDEGVTVY